MIRAAGLFKKKKIVINKMNQKNLGNILITSFSAIIKESCIAEALNLFDYFFPKDRCSSFTTPITCT